MKQGRRFWFIQGPAFDGLFFLGAPLWALLMGFLFSRLSPEQDAVTFLDQQTTLTSMVLRTIIHSHLVLVLFRSHGNAKVRRRHPLRFYLVPILLLGAMMVSLEFLAIVLVVSTYWDMVHSSLQTFGIGRIYDARAGADVDRGRTLDLWLNHVIYLGPFIAGPLWLAVLQVFALAEREHVPFTLEAAAMITQVQPAMRMLVFIAAPAVVIAYAIHVVRRARAGQPVSRLKLALFATTATASVWAWGFNSFGQALLVVNTFHAVQYFALVWWSERDNMSKLFGTRALPWSQVLTAACFIIVGLAYGFWLGSVSEQWAVHEGAKRFVLALTNTVALLHFWYDGFIWSVRGGVGREVAPLDDAVQ